MAKKSATVAADPSWRPDPQLLKSFRNRFWRADENQPWEDLNATKFTGTPTPIPVGDCDGYAIFQLQTDGTWQLVEDHCVPPCAATEPLPSPSPMPVGMQIMVPC